MPHESRHSDETLWRAAGLQPSPFDAEWHGGADPGQELTVREIEWLELVLNSSAAWGRRSLIQEYDLLLRLRLERQLSISIGVIDPALVVKHATYSLSPWGSSSEGADHMLAKHVAHAWLRSRRGNPVMEARRYGGRVDVFCDKIGIAVECGSLSAGRLEAMLFDHSVVEALVIPLGVAIEEWISTGEPTPVPYIRFRLEGNWPATRKQVEDLRREQASAAVDRLTRRSLPVPLRDGVGE